MGRQIRCTIDLKAKNKFIILVSKSKQQYRVRKPVRIITGWPLKIYCLIALVACKPIRGVFLGGQPQVNKIKLSVLSVLSSRFYAHMLLRRSLWMVNHQRVSHVGMNIAAKPAKKLIDFSISRWYNSIERSAPYQTAGSCCTLCFLWSTSLKMYFRKRGLDWLLEFKLQKCEV